ncbi:hypothetical protein Hanom_Chr01g00053981 [Helianthus anomalus]
MRTVCPKTAQKCAKTEPNISTTISATVQPAGAGDDGCRCYLLVTLTTAGHLSTSTSTENLLL